MLRVESNALCFYGLQGVSLVIKFDKGRCMDLIGIFPSVVTFGVPFPLDQILQVLMMSPSPVSMDLFHFIFLFSINQIRWRSGEVRAM
jgi:hypothetical protein